MSRSQCVEVSLGRLEWLERIFHGTSKDASHQGVFNFMQHTASFYV